MRHGIDISSQQHPKTAAFPAGAPISYNGAVAFLRNLSGGLQPFVFVKAIEGDTYVNPYFAQDVAGFRAAGALVGAYLFDHGTDNPVTEQTLFNRIAAGIPEADDDETSAAGYALHCAQLVALSPNKLQYLNQSAVKAGWLSLGSSLWLADYDNEPGAVPAGWNVLIHQYWNLGRVPGILTTTDMNVWLGDEASIDNFFNITVTNNPPIINTTKEDFDVIQLEPGKKCTFPARPVAWTLLFGYDDAGGPVGTGVTVRVAIGTTTPGPWNGVPTWGGKDFGFWVPIGVPVSVPVPAGQLVSVVNTGTDSVGLDRVI